VALAALDELRARLPVHMQAVRTGLVMAAPTARFQVMPGRPAVVFDVAHNPHAARALSHNLRAHVKFERTIAVFAMLIDKDITGVVEAVGTQVDAWFIAGLAGARGTRAGDVADRVRSVVPEASVQTFESVRDAYAAARQCAGENDRILVFGSFHTVSEGLQAHRASVRSTAQR
jgi:dihydrofolate synthase / folylpolyglutamate synthase